MQSWMRNCIPGGLAAFGFIMVVAAALLLWPAPAPPTFADVKAGWQPSYAYLLDRQGREIGTARIDHGIRRLEWVPLEQVSPALTQAIVQGEDQRFYKHHGVDWRGMTAAAKSFITGSSKRGGSTISMQVATLIDPGFKPRETQRGVLYKLTQIRAARALEEKWTKPQILEAYLNLLDFRGELQGINAATWRLAGKAPSGLDLGESLVLAALLPSPSASIKNVARRACARAANTRLPITCDQIKSTASAILLRHPVDEPGDDLAPHLAAQLLHQPGQRLVTTLDANIQRLAKNSLAAHLSLIGQKNVRDGAVLVIDNETGNVLAYVASNWNTSRAQMVDGITAPRQAGSTLKPFLYALAFERGYLTAASILDDSPVDFNTASGLYLPQDYDRDFKGPVTVRTALASSLNIPAVRSLVLVGVEPFRDRLHDLGYVGLIHDGEYYGYSLALGSAEVTLFQQVAAYRALARGGMWSPLRLLQTEKIPQPRRVMPAAATFIIGQILSDRAARITTFGLSNNLNTRFWSAVKTGTSKDMRDNWCIGYSSKYTVGVWVGNFEGDSMHDVSGVTGAAPIWHEVITALNSLRPSKAPSPPAGVVTRAITFEPAIETPRREYFMAGTAIRTVRQVQKASLSAHISSPANGIIIAIDPDIPANYQRISLETEGDITGLTFYLDDTLIGPASDHHFIIPHPGAHRLTLRTADGQDIDRILFTVRGAGGS